MIGKEKCELYHTTKLNEGGYIKSKENMQYISFDLIYFNKRLVKLQLLLFGTWYLR